MLSMTRLRSSGRVRVASAHSPPYVATSCWAMTSDHCVPNSALACAARPAEGACGSQAGFGVAGYATCCHPLSLSEPVCRLQKAALPSTRHRDKCWNAFQHH